MPTLTTEVLGSHVAKTKRKFKKRHLTVGASEIGLCERRVGYIKKSQDKQFIVTQNEDHIDGWGATSRGNTFETLWVAAMRNWFGKKNVLFAGKEQRTLQLGNLSATPDALLINQPRNLLANLMVPDIGTSHEVVVDAKSIDPRIRLSQPKPNHVFQIQVQLGLIRELTKHKPDYGWLSYTNASFFDDSTDFVVQFDPNVYAVAKRRANRIINSESAAELKPEGWIAGGEECKWCAFSKTCAQMRGPPPDAASSKKLDPQYSAMLSDLAREERNISKDIDALENYQRELQWKIKEAMREKGLRRIDDSGINIIWSTVVGRPSYDMVGIRDAAAKLGLNIEQFTRVGESTDRLTIRVLPRDRLIANRKNEHGKAASSNAQTADSSRNPG
jgi:hypothetical protein